MVKPRAFSHAAVRVSNVNKARKFYEEVLGLKPIPRPDFSFGGAWYGIGKNMVHLIASRKRKGIDPLGPHIAIQVKDFDKAKKAIRELGIKFVELPQFANLAGRQIWVQDPDGNTIELRSNP